MGRVKELIDYEESRQDYIKLIMEEELCGDHTSTVHTSTDTNSKNGRSNDGPKLRRVRLRKRTSKS